MELVAPAVRKREGRTPLPDAHQFREQVGQMVSNKVHDLALALHASFDRDHAGPRMMRRCRSNTFGQTTRLAIPASSSMVMNITPFALPGGRLP
ncbi:hypothetical protein KEU06_20595 [Pseudaminobacter sp. 19-2017]|uniref:Uncharacterized protein n=1 Tax=Pseudaminobacter soli (ex Zhang et al. 2022) TaxID=2831468 RepID=A0A942E0T8_9HYPH|nr:hypothetical protein [Pseudaminobacter soli]